MDWVSLKAEMIEDRDYPERTFVLQARDQVLMGTHYDVLEFPFSKENHDDTNNSYIPLDKRRPSVRTNLARTVVDDSVSLLFSEGHWPNVVTDEGTTKTTQGLSVLIKERKLNAVLIDAATRGSVGSVAVLLRIIKSVPFFDVMPTAFLTPHWDPTNPAALAAVTQRYKVKGSDLLAMGYPGFKPSETLWFMRRWTDQFEEWYQPQTLEAAGEGKAPVLDPLRTLRHGLGFCPIVWGRNLPPYSMTDADGACTFECALDTIIEMDYLLSQAGRGLKYSSDPTLVLKGNMDPSGAPAQVGGAAGAIELPPEADAKLLEINGNAAAAVLAHVQELRAIALEAMHGNRTHADRLSAAQSGRAIEMMMTGLIWVADRLRISYGEGVLLGLLDMVCRASQVVEGGLIVGGEKWKGEPEGLKLSWKPWVLPTYQDLLQFAQALETAVAGGIMSAATAVARFGAVLDIDDPTPELAQIKAELVDKQAREDQLTAAAAAAKPIKQAAGQGTHTTKEITA